MMSFDEIMNMLSYLDMVYANAMKKYRESVDAVTKYGKDHLEAITAVKDSDIKMAEYRGARDAIEYHINSESKIIGRKFKIAVDVERKHGITRS